MTSINYAVSPDTHPIDTLARTSLFIVICGIAGFLVFITLNVLFVLFAPSHINDYEWTSLGFPLGVGGLALYRFRSVPMMRRVELSILCALLASLLGIALLFVPGGWIHFAVGGEL